MDRGGFKLPCLVGHNNAHRDVFCTREGVRARGRWLTSGYPSAPNRRQCAPLSAWTGVHGFSQSSGNAWTSGPCQRLLRRHGSPRCCPRLTEVLDNVSGLEYQASTLGQQNGSSSATLGVADAQLLRSPSQQQRPASCRLIAHNSALYADAYSCRSIGRCPGRWCWWDVRPGCGLNRRGHVAWVSYPTKDVNLRQLPDDQGRGMPLLRASAIPAHNARSFHLGPHFNE